VLVFEVSAEDIENVRFERGKRDAEKGRPPTDPSKAYRDGYAVGNRWDW
jgi:hypothetical protein